MKQTILIRDVQLVQGGISPRCDMLIQDGVIAKLGKDLNESAHFVIDGSRLTALPGLFDMHVHLRDPGFEEKETIETGCRAAAHGGYTTILAMPNTKPVVDNPDVVNYVHNKAKTVGLVNVLQVGAVTKNQEGKELADIEGMVKAGIPAISEDGKSVMNAQLYREAMEKAAKLGIVVLAHCEDKNLVNGGVMNEDEHARELGLKGITNSVEDIIVARDIMLSHDTGAKLHLCHCSTEDSVMMVDLAKQKNVKVTAEVCPHHFTLTSDDIRKIAPEMDVEKNVIAADADADTNFKMNPPLRTENDRLAIIEGLKDGTIALIATDHAPHSTEEKSRPITQTPSGIIGLETSLALGITSLVRPGHLTLSQLIEKMTINPASLYHLPCGSVAEGKSADLVLFDPNEKWIPETYASKSSNSPFTGWELYGKVKYTICDGKIVYKD